ncbi:glycosyltransferase [Neptunomonas phycophila]|uniref:glycosyltransferase n=1 Tax=Neptunomonas phycophila TaxID=1572645 RepID=UPI000948EF3C|nr:glycosyltransferase [Neptunomonas phycophila]
MLSIITVTYNNLNGLKTTYKSIRKLLQNEVAVKWIVIDGASEDGTLSFLRMLSTNLDSNCFLYFSESDKGLYDAMNKGLDLVDGDYIIFINAGDLIHESLLKDLQDYNSFDILLGASERFSSDKKYIKYVRPLKKLNSRMICEHQAFVVRSAIAKKIRYDLRYSLSADYDFLCRCIKSTDSIYSSKRIYCSFEYGGVSKKKRMEALLEDFLIRIRVFNMPYKNAFYLYLKHLSWEVVKKIMGLIR